MERSRGCHLRQRPKKLWILLGIFGRKSFLSSFIQIKLLWSKSHSIDILSTLIYFSFTSLLLVYLFVFISIYEVFSDKFGIYFYDAYLLFFFSNFWLLLLFKVYNFYYKLLDHLHCSFVSKLLIYIFSNRLELWKVSIFAKPAN